VAALEAERAQLVAIASDVDPIEIAVWLPALCRRLGAPHAIARAKARLGAVAGSEPRRGLQQILSAVAANVYRDRMRELGGGLLSEETVEKLRAQGKRD
jgi:large subunit ribosomal protein L7Ae